MRQTSTFSFFSALLAMLAICGCGGSGYLLNTTPIVVGVKSSATAIDQSQQVSLTATVTNAPGNDASGVTWGTPTCSAPPCGTLSNVTSTGATYSPPSTLAAMLSVTVTATSIKDPTQSGSTTFLVAPNPVVTTTSVAAPATIGSPYALQLISGGTPPYILQFSGSGSSSASSIPGMQVASAFSGAANGGSCTGLPSWLTFNQNTGVLSAVNGAIPSTATDFVCTVTVKDNLGVASAGVTVRILVPMVITTTSLPATEQTQPAYNASLTGMGGSGVYSWSVLGSLPSGLALNSNTGVISGTVGASATTQKFTIQVTGSENDAPVTQDFTIAVAPRLAVAALSASDLTFNISSGRSLSLQTVAGTGVGPFHWTAASPLPSWLKLSDDGKLSATAVPDSATTSQITVQVSDSFNLAASAPLNITVPILITTASLPSAEQLQPTYAGTLKAAGGSGTYSWSVDSGSLPAGLSLNAGTGVISGAPALTATEQNFVIRVADSTGVSVSQTYTISINPQVAIVAPPASNLVANIRSSYSLTLQIAAGTGVAPFIWSAPALPPWLNLSSAGVLSALNDVPATATTQSITVQVKDAANVVATVPLTVTVPIIIGPSSPLPKADQSQANYSVGLTAIGGTGTYSSWNVVAGALPSGLTINPSTGLISGALAGNAASQTFTAQVLDSSNATGSQNYTITVNPALVVSTTSLPDGAVNNPYTQTLSPSGGTPPYGNWQVASGSLPTNVFLDSATGTLSSGTGTVQCPGGAFNFSVTVQDSLDNTSAPQPLSVKMTTTPLAITTTSIASYAQGLPYSQQLQFTGSACGATVTWSVASGSLPAWLTLSPSGLLSGTPGPNDSGSVDIVVQATDGVTKDTKTLTLAFSAVFKVSGKISLVNGGGPLQGATVSLGPLTATTDSGGNFSISTGNGTHTITPSLTGPNSVFIPASSSITNTNGVFAITVNGANLENVNFNAQLGYTVSGEVTYAGKITPQNQNEIFIRLEPTGCSDCSVLGTRVPKPRFNTSSKFSLQGVPPGTYSVQAFMDFAGYGIQNAIDPSGASASPITVSTSNGNVTNVAVTINDAVVAPVFPTDPAPQFRVSAIVDNGTFQAGTNQGVIVEYQPIMLNNVEQAEFYTLQWAPSVDPPDSSCESAPEGGLTFGDFAGDIGDPITAGSGRIVILDQLNQSDPLNTFLPQAQPFQNINAPYTFCMRAIAATPTGGALQSLWTTLDRAVIPITGQPTAPAPGTNAVTVNVTIPDSVTPSGPLYVGCYDLGSRKVYAVSDETVALGITGTMQYVINGVPTGAQCLVFASIDNDNNGLITPANPTQLPLNGFPIADLSNTRQNANPILITGNTTVGLDLTPFAQNSAASVTTQHTQVTANGNTQDFYDLIFNVRPLLNLPVKVTLLSGPNVVAPMDFALCEACGYKSEFNVVLSTFGARPQVGDRYVLQISYPEDLPAGVILPDQLTVTVTGVSDAFPASLSLVGTAPSNTPTFSWSDPGNADSYTYQFALWDSSGIPIWQIPGPNSLLTGFPSSITSVPWSTTTDPTGDSNPPSVSSLTSGSTYTWAVRALDNHGNSAQTQVDITVP